MDFNLLKALGIAEHGGAEQKGHRLGEREIPGEARGKKPELGPDTNTPPRCGDNLEVLRNVISDGSVGPNLPRLVVQVEQKVQGPVQHTGQWGLT